MTKVYLQFNFEKSKQLRFFRFLSEKWNNWQELVKTHYACSRLSMQVCCCCCCYCWLLNYQHSLSLSLSLSLFLALPKFLSLHPSFFSLFSVFSSSFLLLSTHTKHKSEWLRRLHAIGICTTKCWASFVGNSDKWSQTKLNHV